MVVMGKRGVRTLGYLALRQSPVVTVVQVQQKGRRGDKNCVDSDRKFAWLRLVMLMRLMSCRASQALECMELYPHHNWYVQSPPARAPGCEVV